MKTELIQCFRATSIFIVFMMLIVSVIIMVLGIQFVNINTILTFNSAFHYMKSVVRTSNLTENNDTIQHSGRQQSISHPIQSSQMSITHVDGQNSSKKRKLILYYNRISWMDKKFDNFEKCPYKCDTSSDKRKWNDSDAVVFLANLNPAVPKMKKVPGQAWVLFALEPPAKNQIRFQKWRNLINWTMTYRIDSDIPLFNHVIERKESESSVQAPVNKTAPAAWAVSNCKTPSRRRSFTKMLQKYIGVDIYGRCGKMKASRCGGHANTCWKKDFNKYFFYLSFENSFCRDYITEKVFVPLRDNIVPIVRGSATYSKFLPLKSYINTADFKTVKGLADHLTSLMQNKLEYDKYFAWKQQYISRVYCCLPKSICELCRRLHSTDNHERIYYSVQDWWHKGGNCNTADDLH